MSRLPSFQSAYDIGGFGIWCCAHYDLSRVAAFSYFTISFPCLVILSKPSKFLGMFLHPHGVFRGKILILGHIALTIQLC